MLDFLQDAIQNKWKKESQTLMLDFFTKCNTRLMGKAGTWRDTDWAKEDRLCVLARPMGEIRKHYDITVSYTHLTLPTNREV